MLLRRWYMTSVSGLEAAMTVVVETTATAVQRLVGHTGAQGNWNWNYHSRSILSLKLYP
jgi:hypothetical protein